MRSFALFILLSALNFHASAQELAADPATKLTEAEAAIVQHEWKGAATKLSAWLALHPSDARALFDQGYVTDAQGKLEEAADLYRRSVEADPKSFVAHLSLGLLLARQGKLEEARLELVACTKLDSTPPEPALKARAWRALSRIDRASDPAEASNDLLEALKLSPESLDDTLLAANLAEEAGENQVAEQAYRRVLAQNPKSSAASTGLAHLLILGKQFSEAEEFLRSALDQIPGDPTLTAQLAAVLVAENKAEAQPLLEKLHGAHPTDAAITRMLAKVLAQAGEIAGSDRLYLALLVTAPQDVDLLLGHGQNLIRQFQYFQAQDIFEKATQLDAANADAWSGLAYAASKNFHPTLALHALTMRSRYLPESASTYFLWASAYESLHQKSEAAIYYHHFLEASNGQFPDQERQARESLRTLEKDTKSRR